MKKLSFSLAATLISCFALGCTAKSETKGFLLLRACYKLVREHYTDEKPEVLTLDTLKEWAVCGDDWYDQSSRIKSNGTREIVVTLVGAEGKNEYVCPYELLVDGVGQSGFGYVKIRGEQNVAYLINTWALCIDLRDAPDGNGRKRTLEFQMWGC